MLDKKRTIAIVAVNVIETALLAVLISGVIAQEAYAMSCAELSGGKLSPRGSGHISQSPAKTLIEKKVLAVSVLREIPNSNVIEPNYLDFEHFDKPYELPTKVKFGTNFALGEMVRSHSAGSWENRTVAIVKPLGELNGLININPYDTLVLGNILLTPNTTLIVPKGTQVRSVEGGYKVFEYDPQEMNLRTAVDRVIEAENGWSIRMKENVNEQVDAEFEIGGQTYKTSSFFKEFLSDKPHVSIGNELISLNGHSFRFGIISQVLVRYLNSFSSLHNDFGQRYFSFQLHIIEHHMKSLVKSGVLENLPVDTKEKVFRTFKIADGMLNIGRLDQYLRTQYSKTLVNSDLTSELWHSRADFASLKKIAESIPGFVADLQKTDSEPLASPQYYALLLSTLPNSEREQFVARYPDLLPQNEISEIMGYVQKFLARNPHAN